MIPIIRSAWHLLAFEGDSLRALFRSPVDPMFPRADVTHRQIKEWLWDIIEEAIWPDF